MMMKKWEDLPESMQTDEVRKYYDILKKKSVSLFFKRCFDVVVALILLALLLPVFIIVAIAIKIDSKGPVFYRQERVTQYGEVFRIFKFRTMVVDADKIGAHVTTKDDPRITRVGRVIRKLRLDEICQLIDILRGTMTFVGTRPEAIKYVEHYTPEMMATLLLPAGVTSLASILYKDEDKLLEGVSDPDAVYINEVLPAKMKYNLRALETVSFFGDIKLMFMTVFAVLGVKFKDELKEEKERETQTQEV